MKKIKKYIIVIVIVFLYLFLGLYNGLKITRIEYRNAKIPQEFEGYKIVQITDLHCAVFGKEQRELIKSIEKENPDLIVITGDMFDKKRWNYESLQSLLEGISGIAPIYAVTGNNEYDDKDMYAILMDLYEEYGVKMLEDEAVEIRQGDSKIYLYGMYYRYYVTQQYFTLMGESNQFNVLLYHDPSQFEKLRKNGFDLILSGHTHGGIVRLPLAGGVIGNDGGFFPQFDYGMYHADNCDIYVSTGLGNLEIPRFYNRPELVVFTLGAQ